MKANILLTELSRIAPLATQNKVVPITSCVKLEFSHDSAKASTTDLQSYVSVVINEATKLEATICVDCVQLINILKGFGELEIDITIKDNQLTIKSGKSEYKLPILDANDFPTQLTPAEETTEIESDLLKDAINSTLFATSKDDLRPAMCGIYFDRDKVVATDAHRLVRFEAEQDLNINAILPHNACSFLSRVINSVVEVSTSNTTLFAKWDNYTFSTRLVDERYPDYNAVIPTSHTSKIIVETKHLIEVVSRLLLTSNKQTHQIRLSLGEECFASSADVDYNTEGVEQIQCQYEGEPMEIGFNGKFIVECLRTVSDPAVKILLIAQNKAGVIECIDKTILIMPVMI